MERSFSSSEATVRYTGYNFFAHHTLHNKSVCSLSRLSVLGPTAAP